MNRRQLFSVGLGGAGAAVLLTQCSRDQHPQSRDRISSQSRPEVVPLAQSAATGTTVYTSADGLLELDLEASYQTLDLGGSPATLMAYNGQVPGPRLEAKPGDTVRIHFTNNLPDPTNIHYHGLNISRIGTGDNVFLDIQPGETFTYEFTLPENHPAGTFWYHPHRHGFVADQVFAGLSGFFIVRGELDEIPEVSAASEVFLALKDFQLDGSGQLAEPDRMAKMMGREGQLVTASGEVNPLLSVPEGGLLRLRLLNASVSRFYRLQLEGHTMHLIATDGGAIAAPVDLQELLLTPGERAEVLVQCDLKSSPTENRTSDTYRLLNLPYNRGGMGMGMMGSAPETISGSQPVATFAYTSATTTAAVLPTQLIPIAPLPKPANTRRIELSMRMSFMRGMAFTLNDKVFDPERIDIQLPLGTTEEWEIANVDTDMMDHPFHIHSHAFQIVSRNGQPEPYLAWKDTVLVKGGETVRIRIPFKDFAGKSVYHCHVLDYEELGMMGVVNVTS